MARLTRKAIEAAQGRAIKTGKPVVLRDPAMPGLSITFGQRGGRWRFDYKIPLPGGGWSGGRRIALGDIEAVDVDAARDLAREAKELIAEGIDPAAARKARREANIEASASQTVLAGIERYVDERSPDWTAGTRRAFAGDFRVIRAAIGDAPLALVQRPALVDLIEAFLAAKRREGVSGLRQAVRIANHLGALWRQAGPGSPTHAGWGWHGVDPIVADRLPVPGRHRLVARKRTFSEAELRKLWGVLCDGVTGSEVGRAPRLVLQLSLVTGLRIGALALLRADDLDLDPAVIVGARDNGPTIRIRAVDGTKATARARREGNDLVLPIAALAVRLFREALALRSDPRSPFVFLGRPRTKPLSPETVSRAYAALAEAAPKAVPPDAVAHDLRRTARTMLGELDHGGTFEDEERLIGHAVGRGVSRVYDRGRRLARLRPLADAWAARLEAIVSARPAEVHRLGSAQPATSRGG